MPTPYTSFYTPLRTVLGDRDAYGLYAYPDADLVAALDVIFLTGGGPDGFTAAAGQITPEVEAGDDFALILFRAALLLITGEDGAGSMRTRALSVSDQGQRKRDLTTELRIKISSIENGGGIAFETRQALGVYIQNLTGASMLDWIDSAHYRLPILTAPIPLLLP